MSSQFEKIPKYEFEILSKNPFRRGVVLKGDLVYFSYLLCKYIKVDSGFKSDGASVPQFLWDRLPPFDQYLEAAIIHDFYCVLGKQKRSPIDYKMAAKVFREAMKACGIPFAKRHLMYLAVRYFGPKFKANEPRNPRS